MGLQDAEKQNAIFIERSNCTGMDALTWTGVFIPHPFKANATIVESDVLSCLYALSAEEVISSAPWFDSLVKQVDDFCFRNVFPYYNHPSDMDVPSFSKGPGAMLGIVDGLRRSIAFRCLITYRLCNPPARGSSFCQW